MKTLSRFLAVMLAAAMLLSCSMASAEGYNVPKKVSAIELPDMPDVPTMKTKNNGVTETVTLSDEVEWLSAVWNWEWVSIPMDGTTGTYDITGRKCQQGMGTWQSTWDAPWLWVEGEGISYDAFNVYDTTEPGAIDQWFEDAQAYLKANDPGIKYTVTKYPHGVDRHSAGYIAYVFTDAVPGDEEIFGEGYLGYWNAFWTCDKWCEGFGTYEMMAYAGIGDGGMGVEFAFDGATKDGVAVKYDRFGRNTARSIKLDDVNFFETEVAPTSTEVVWARIIKSNGAPAYYPYTIIATYEEGDYASIQAWYSSNGSLIQSLASKAE